LSKESPATVAVLDMGKSNIKLSAVTRAGEGVETVSIPNPVLPGPPCRRHDLDAITEWVMAYLSIFCRRHPISNFVTSGHGSGGVLVGNDPDGLNGGAALPMIDYEQEAPDVLNEAYLPLCGSFLDRGSVTLQAMTHQGRQLYLMQREDPARFAKARWFLNLPQYWAWRLTGVARCELSIMGAQSHLWNVVERRFAPIVESQGWQSLMPLFAPAWQPLGTIRNPLAARYGLPDNIQVHNGAHDSSVNFYRYQTAGLTGITVVSTGTWLVALADGVNPDLLDEHRNMTCNSDVFGKPLGGALTMGGREFHHVAGKQRHDAVADLALVAKLVQQRTFALPSFGAESGQVKGSAGRGRIMGPPPQDSAERLALAVLYLALLTVSCANTLGAKRTIVLDGTYLRDPLYARLVAALRPNAETLENHEGDGVASGAALLCSHETRREPAPITLSLPQPLSEFADLGAYASEWFQLTRDMSNLRSRM
jgi:sugar (pentulose or hexulose) kinase